MNKVIKNIQFKLAKLVTEHQYLVASVAILYVLLLAEPALANGLFELRSAGVPEFESDIISCAVGSIYLLIEGPFGALIMVVAGLGAIISAAMGAYRAMVGMLVVALGSFILRALVSLFFESSNFMPCS